MTEVYETMKVKDESIIIFKPSPNTVLLWVDRGQPLNLVKFQNVCPERERERVDKKGKKDDPVALRQFLIL